MHGGTESIESCDLHFPDTDASAVAVDIQKGTFSVKYSDWYGKGYLKCAAGTITKLTALFDDPSMGAKLTGNAQVIFPDNCTLGFVEVASGNTADIDITSSNNVVRLKRNTSGTVGLGGGKLDIDMTLLSDEQGTDKTVLQVDGKLLPAAGSTLDIDASKLLDAGTYNILSYGSVENAANLKIASVKLPGATAAVSFTTNTLDNLQACPISGVSGDYAFLLRRTGTLVTLTLSDKNKWYWSKDEDSSGWDSCERWWSNEERAGEHRAQADGYPNTTSADVYVGYDSCTRKQVLAIKSISDGGVGTITIGHLTMNGGPGATIGGGGSLIFPSNGDVSTPIIENNKGTLIFSRLGLQGNGEIRCAADTVTQFSRTPIDTATHKISVSAEGLTDSQSATVNVYANSSSAYVQQYLYYLQTGSSSTSTTYLNISNLVLNLTSSTPVSGTGKLAMTMTTGAWNANNKTNAFLSAPNGTLTIPAGSTLALDFSDATATVGSFTSTYTGTYKLIEYNACETRGNLTITSLTLPGGDASIGSGRTLDNLATSPVAGVVGDYSYVLKRDGNVLTLTLTDKNKWYWTDNHPSADWNSSYDWYYNQDRAGGYRSAYPNSSDADVYVGHPTNVTELLSVNGDYQLRRLTMEGGEMCIGDYGGDLLFSDTATSPNIINNKGTLFLSFIFLKGQGVIQTAPGTTTRFGTVIAMDGDDFGVVNNLAAGETATNYFTVKRKDYEEDACRPTVLSYVQSGAAGSTLYLNVSNTCVRLKSTSVATGGDGKLDMTFTLGAFNERNAPHVSGLDPTTVMLDVNGTLTIADGSTLAIDASRVGVGTYDLVKYGTCTTAAKLSIASLTLPGGGTATLPANTTLASLTTAATGTTSGGLVYTLQNVSNTLTLTLLRPLTFDHAEISFDNGENWETFASGTPIDVGYGANTPQYRAIYTGWAAGDGPSVRIDNICTGYKQGDTPGTENGHAAWDGTYDVYVPKNYATVVHGMPTVPAGYSASAFDNLTLGTVTLNPLVFTWNKTEDDVWGAPANWDRNYTTPGCTNVPSSKYDTVSFSNRTAVVTVDGTYTIGRYCDTATSDVTIQGVSPNRVTYLAHETTAAPMPMELLGKLVVRALGDDGYSPFKVTRWICEAYHNNVARPVLVMEGLHEHCAAEGDRAANYGGVRTFVIKDCQINMTYAISRPSDVWNEQKGTYAKVLMDGSVITSSSSSYQEGIGRSAGVVRLTNSTWTAAYFRSQVLDTAPVVDLVNGKFYYSYYANQWLSSLSVSGADSELRTYAPDAPASGQTLTLKGTLNVTFPAGLNGFTNATGAVHAPIKATTVDMGSLSTVNISATGYAVGTYPLVAAYNAMTLPTPTTTSIAVDAGKYGRLVLTDSDKTLALQIGNITAVTIPTMAISHEKTGADLKQTITIDPEDKLWFRQGGI